MDAAMNVVEMREGRRACAKLPKPAPAAAAREARKAAVKANAQQIQPQRYSPCALGSIAAVVTGLSLSHRDARSLRRCSSSCARVTPWWSRGSTGSPGPCVTYRTVSTTFDNAASPSRRPSSRSTPAPRRASASSTCLASCRVRDQSQARAPDGRHRAGQGERHLLGRAGPPR